MSDDSRPTVNQIHAILAELGIVDPISIATAKQQHAEVIAAYENGKLNEAALRQSIVRTPDKDWTKRLDTRLPVLSGRAMSFS